MADQTTNLDITVPDPNAVNKALRTADGLEQLSKAVSYIYTLDATSLGASYTLPYSSTTGGNKTGLHFGVLALTGTPSSAFTIVAPARTHKFIVDNRTGQTAYIKANGSAQTGVGVTAGSVASLYFDGTNIRSANSSTTPTESMLIACTGETTVLTVASSVVTFRIPYDFTLTGIRCSLVNEQTSGSVLTVNVKKNGTSILSTPLTFDNNEKTTVTAATPAVISTAFLDDDSEMTVDVTQVGNGAARGLKLTLIGYRT